MASLEAASMDLLEPAAKGWEKKCSPTCSSQTDKKNCLFHTLTKIMIKNIFEKVLDLTLTPTENDRYDSCMPLTIPARVSGYRDGKYPLNVEKRIKLFYYLFSLLEYTNTINVSDALLLLDMPTEKRDIDSRVKPGKNKVYLRTIQYKDDRLLLAMREEFLAKSETFTWKHVHIQMDMESEDFEPIKIQVLAPILSLNLYFEMGLEEVSEDKLPRHIVLITGLDDENIHIKNTWGKLLHEVPWSDEIILEDGNNYKVTDLHTILPMKKGHEVKSGETGEYNVRNIGTLFHFVEEYVSIYPTIFRGGKSRTRRRRAKRRTKRYRS